MHSAELWSRAQTCTAVSCPVIFIYILGAWVSRPLTDHKVYLFATGHNCIVRLFKMDVNQILLSLRIKDRTTIKKEVFWSILRSICIYFSQYKCLLNNCEKQKERFLTVKCNSSAVNIKWSVLEVIPSIVLRRYRFFINLITLLIFFKFYFIRKPIIK